MLQMRESRTPLPWIVRRWGGGRLLSGEKTGNIRLGGGSQIGCPPARPTVIPKSFVWMLSGTLRGKILLNGTLRGTRSGAGIRKRG